MPYSLKKSGSLMGSGNRTQVIRLAQLVLLSAESSRQPSGVSEIPFMTTFSARSRIRWSLPK